MGMTDVTLTVKNPRDPKKAATVDFLVDSGAAYTVVPGKIVKQLKLKASFAREFILADGKKIKRMIGDAKIKFGTEEISTPVVLGKNGDSALLGALTLESFGLALDPFQRKLYRAKMML